MSSWYYVKEGQRNGPVARAELDARIAEGAVNGDTLVWRTGMDAWIPAGSVPDLGLPPPLPAPLQAPAMPGADWPADGEDEPRPRASERTRERFERESGAGRIGVATNPAGFWVRLAAKFIDKVVLYGPALIVQAVVAAVWFDGVVPPMSDWPGMLRMALYCFPFNALIAATYTAYFISRHEATPGKRLLGLRVVRPDGGRVGAARAFARSLAELLSEATFLAGYVMAAFDERKRTLHDCICDTRVVKGPREEE